jgi:hypothetical protein
MITTRERKMGTQSKPKIEKRDPLASLRARGLVTPPRSARRDTSSPTIKPNGGSVADLVREWR